MKKILRLLSLVVLLITMASFINQNVNAIEEDKADLGMLDTLTLSDQYGNIINTDGAAMIEGRTYTLMYKWSLDEPTSDYRNKTALFEIPSVFDSTTISPSTLPLYYIDGEENIQIGSISVDSDSNLLKVEFNNNPILGSKSNIQGWISISAECGEVSTNHTITIDWTGQDNVEIVVDVIEGGVGLNKIATLNKYIKSGVNGGQPIVKQDQDGKFYITFVVEIFISQNYDKLELEDTIYSGMEVDDSSIKVISRPKDGQEYNNVYKENYDLWDILNPTGDLALRKNITSELQGLDAITTSSTGFKVQFDSVDFNNELVSRQLTTTPLQMRYEVEYNTFLTGINPNATLSEAQIQFESQIAKNTVTIKEDNNIITTAEWNKGIIGGGAAGETRGITLKKIDSDTEENLSGAVFNLYKQNAYNSDLWELYQANIEVDDGVADVTGLVFGTYRFEETVAPEGYDLPDNAFDEFTINANTAQSGFTITLENTKTPVISREPEFGAIEFEKVDSEDSSKKLVATFEIRKKDTDEVVATVTTFESGIGIKDGLEEGEYYLIEITAPEGYQLESTKYDFTIVKYTTNNIYLGDGAIKNTKILTEENEEDKIQDAEEDKIQDADEDNSKDDKKSENKKDENKNDDISQAGNEIATYLLIMLFVTIASFLTYILSKRNSLNI